MQIKDTYDSEEITERALNILESIKKAEGNLRLAVNEIKIIDPQIILGVNLIEEQEKAAFKQIFNLLSECNEVFQACMNFLNECSTNNIAKFTELDIIQEKYKDNIVTLRDAIFKAITINSYIYPKA